MAGREVREYTNLTDPKDKKLGKGKDRIDDEEITFQRMVAKMQEVAGERGGYLHGRGALDSDDLLYLKEQMEAEEDAERLLRRTEKRAFAAFKISLKLLRELTERTERLNKICYYPFFFLLVAEGGSGFGSYRVDEKSHKAVAETSPASVPLSLRVEPKPKSGIRQQDLLKRVVAVKAKQQRFSTPSDVDPSMESLDQQPSKKYRSLNDDDLERDESSTSFSRVGKEIKSDNPVKSLLAAYESSDDDD